MDARLHADNLARIASPTVASLYKSLVDELGAGLLACRPHGHGYVKTLRFSRGSWNPIDVIPNSGDLHWYFRAPLFTAHPFALDLAKRAFPEGTAKGREWAIRFSDRETCARLIQFVNTRLQDVIEAHPA